MVNIPPGFQTVTPYLFCDDPLRLVAFLDAAFGGEETGRTERDGLIANLQYRQGTVTMMLSQASERYPARHHAR